LRQKILHTILKYVFRNGPEWNETVSGPLSVIFSYFYSKDHASNERKADKRDSFLRQEASVAPLHVDERPAQSIPRGPGRRRTHRARRRTTANRRHVVVVVGRSRLQPSEAERSGREAAPANGARHVRRPDAYAGRRTGPPAGKDSARRSRQDILLRLRLGSRRSGR